MKNFIKKILIIGVKNETLWKILRPLSVLGLFIDYSRRTNDLAYIRKLQELHFLKSKIVKDLFNSLKVLNGPFKGMKYPKADSYGSAIFPKLLGSYEMELWNCIEKAKLQDYSEIINVGCAEGYYAVGFAQNTHIAKIYAYDSKEKARVLCKEMAELNGVDKKMIIRSTMTAEELGKFKFTSKGLVICDCEGFEKQLFNQKNIENLKNCDLIIETHDFIDIEISTYIRELFKQTHSLESIKSIDDIQKTLNYKFNELNDLSLEVKKTVLREGRPAIMEWLICKSKI